MKSIDTHEQLTNFRADRKWGAKVKYKGTGDLDPSIAVERAILEASDIKVTRRSRTSYLLTKRRPLKAKGGTIPRNYSHVAGSVSVQDRHGPVMAKKVSQVVDTLARAAR